MASSVTLAVIAAAGRGTRFLPCTKTVSKELLPLYDRPIIQYVVEEVAAAGFGEVMIVARPGTAEALRRHLSRDPDWDEYLAATGKTHLLEPLYALLDRISISLAIQPPELPYGTGAPLLAVRERLSGPFAYLYGDDVIVDDTPGQTLRTLVTLYENSAVSAVVGAVQVPRDTISQVGSIAYRPGTGHEVERIIEKPDPALAPSNVTPIGRMILSPAILPVLDAQRERLGPQQELWMTDALTTLATGGHVLAPPIAGRWLTTGDPANWLRAVAVVAESRL